METMLTFTAGIRTGMNDSTQYGIGVLGRFRLRASAIEAVGLGTDGGACILTATRAYLVTETVDQVLGAMEETELGMPLLTPERAAEMRAAWQAAETEDLAARQGEERGAWTDIVWHILEIPSELSEALARDPTEQIVDAAMEQTRVLREVYE